VSARRGLLKNVQTPETGTKCLESRGKWPRPSGTIEPILLTLGLTMTSTVPACYYFLAASALVAGFLIPALTAAASRTFFRETLKNRARRSSRTP
jgi:hypothetical protein